MDMETLRSTLEQANFASLGVGFTAGFIFSFNPVALAAIPVSLAYVTKAHETRRAVLFGAMFIAGMVLTTNCLVTDLPDKWNEVTTSDGKHAYIPVAAKTTIERSGGYLYGSFIDVFHNGARVMMLAPPSCRFNRPETASIASRSSSADNRRRLNFQSNRFSGS